MSRKSKIRMECAAAVTFVIAFAAINLCNSNACALQKDPIQPAMAAAAKESSKAETGYKGAGQQNHAELELNRLHIVLTARKYLGTPYVYGAKYGQTDTFDCSSFAKTVYAEHGMELPRVSRDQAKLGDPVDRRDLAVGDLVFFATDEANGRIGHVGIYVGSGRMIHTYGDGGVKYSRIDAGYWDERYVTARRLVK